MAERPRSGPPGRRPGGDAARSTQRRKQAQRRHRPGDPQGVPTPALDADGPVRLNRFLARAGVASRREADALIEAGRVRVNGAPAAELGAKVSPTDRVEVDGRLVRPKGPVYVLLNKPKDAITTTDDERGRRTVMDLLPLPPDEKEGLFPVGRLDRDTTGVLLLTNDGDLAHRLMHPRYVVEKLYVVRTEEPVKPDEIDRLRQGVLLDDGVARADQVGYASEDPREVAVLLHEGRNRQVRRMFEALGHRIEGLDRIRYAGLSLTGLRRGRWRKLAPHEINTLRRLVKLKAIVF